MVCASIQYHIPSRQKSIEFSSCMFLGSLLVSQFLSKEDLTTYWSHIALPLTKSLMLEYPVTLSQHTRISNLMRWWIPLFNIRYVGCSASFDESFGRKILNKSKMPPLMSL